MPSSKHQTTSGSQIGFFSKFKVIKQSVKSNGRKRSRFDPQRRLEVKAVRGRRACLRCSLLRIKVRSLSNLFREATDSKSVLTMIYVPLAIIWPSMLMKSRRCLSPDASEHDLTRSTSLTSVSGASNIVSVQQNS